MVTKRGSPCIWRAYLTVNGEIYFTDWNVTLRDRTHTKARVAQSADISTLYETLRCHRVRSKSNSVCLHTVG